MPDGPAFQSAFAARRPYLGRLDAGERRELLKCSLNTFQIDKL